MFEWLWKKLYGDDIFISYSRADAESYATTLATKLTDKSYSCKFDRWGSQPGKKMPKELIKALRRSAVLVLVGTEGAAKSKNVAEEIEEFKKTKGIIIPIIFDGVGLNDDLFYKNGKLIKRTTDQKDSSNSLSPKSRKALCADSIAGLSLSWETSQALNPQNPSTPSEEIIERIEKTFNFRRKDERLRLASRIATGVLLLLLIASLAAGVSALVLGQRATEANRKASEQEKRAEEASNLANTKTKEAQEATNRANKQAKIANVKTQEANESTNRAENANKAQRIAELNEKKAVDGKGQAENARNEANRQKGLAEKDRDLANKVATEQRKLAKEQTAIAEQKTTQANRLFYAANMRSADSLYKEGNIKSFADLLDEADPELRGYEWSYLNSKYKSLKKTLVNFVGAEQIDGELFGFSPLGTFLVTSNRYPEKSALFIWNPQTGEKIKELSFDQEKYVVNIAFSHDEKRLVSCSNKKLKIWDTSNWSEISSTNTTNFELSNEYVSYVSFVKKSNELLTVSSVNNKYFLRRWNIQPMKQIGEAVKISNPIKEREDIVFHGFSQDGRLLVSYMKSDSKAQVSLFDAELNEDQQLIEHDVTISKDWTDPGKNNPDLFEYNYSLSAEGDRIAVQHRLIGMSMLRFDESIYIWKTINNGELFQEFEGADNFEISPDGKLLAVRGDSSSPTIIWDIDSYRVVRIMNTEFSRGLSYAFSPNSSKFVSGGNDSRDTASLSLWEVPFQGDIFTFDNEKPRALSSDGTKVVTWNGSDSLTLWDKALSDNRKKVSVNIDVLDDHEPIVSFSPNETYFFAILSDVTSLGRRFKHNSLQMWDVKTGSKVELKSDPNCKNSEVVGFGLDKNELAGKVIFSSEGKRLANICENGTVLVWNLEKEEKPKRLKTKIKDARRATIHFIQNDEKILVLDVKYDMEVWEIGREKPEPTPKEIVIMFSPDGKWFVTKDSGNKYFLQNVIEKEKRRIPLDANDADKIFFSNDGKFLSISGESDFYLKDLTTMEVVKLEDPGGIDRLESSSRGRWVLYENKYSGSSNYWNTSTGKINSINMCGRTPTFSPDEKRLITSCKDGTIWLWDLEIGRAVLSIKAHKSLVRKIIMLDDKTMLTATDIEVKLWTTEF